MDGVIHFLGCVNLFGFFAADLYFAFVLSQLKKDHPAIDDCAPPPPINYDDDMEGYRGVERGYGNIDRGSNRHDDDHHHHTSGNSSMRSSFASDASSIGSSASAYARKKTRIYQDTPTDPVTLMIDAAKNKGNGEIANLFGGLNPREVLRSRSSAVYNDIEMQTRGPDGELDNENENSVALQRQRLIHIAVIIASFGGPFFSLLQIMFPKAMRWSMFHSPTIFGYLATVPAFVLVVIYAARAMRIGTFVEVSKAQWLSMAWFRLDVMVIMALMILVGWGDWLVSLCLLIVGFYLAFRLLETERRLTAITQETQLLREQHLQQQRARGGENGVPMPDHEIIGLSNGSGVVRSAILAAEQQGFTGVNGQQFMRNFSDVAHNDEDVFRGRTEAGEASGGGGISGGGYGTQTNDSKNNGSGSGKRAVAAADFFANNQPTDSETEGYNTVASEHRHRNAARNSAANDENGDGYTNLPSASESYQQPRREEQANAVVLRSSSSSNDVSSKKKSASSGKKRD